jgi:hypothetical protein
MISDLTYGIAGGIVIMLLGGLVYWLVSRRR